MSVGTMAQPDPTCLARSIVTTADKTGGVLLECCGLIQLFLSGVSLKQFKAVSSHRTPRYYCSRARLIEPLCLDELFDGSRSAKPDTLSVGDPLPHVGTA